jgi:hypothetical protein
MPMFDITNSAHDGENPLMALVDAALDRQIKEGTSEDVSDLSSSSSSEDESLSRPSTPPATTALLVPAVSPVSVASAGGSTTSIEGTLGTEKKLSFAEQLMATLDKDEFSDILTWMPNGKAFTIVDPKRFTKDHMPGLFNIRNMSSFVRKLTRWGFSRVHEKETLNSDIFKHPEFQQGKPELCRGIKCVGRTPMASSASLPRSSAAAAIVAPRAVLLPKASPKATSRPLPERKLAFPQSAMEPLRQDSHPYIQSLALHRFMEHRRAVPSLPGLNHHHHVQSPWGHWRPGSYQHRSLLPY